MSFLLLGYWVKVQSDSVVFPPTDPSSAEFKYLLTFSNSCELTLAMKAVNIRMLFSPYLNNLLIRGLLCRAAEAPGSHDPLRLWL